MKKFITFALIAAMMLSMIVVGTSAAAWDGTSASTALEGDGSAATPYLVKSAEDLAFLAQSVDDGTTYAGKYITQTADIDLGNKEFPTIGNDGKQFQGVYDGKGFKITNYASTLSEYDSGLFARVNSTADFQAAVINVTLEGSVSDLTYTNAADHNIGLLVGKLAGNGSKLAVVANCVVDVDVNINKELDNSGKIVYLGGVVGYATAASITNCVNKGDINVVFSGKHLFVAGIVAQSYYQMVVEGCANYGNINVEAKDSKIVIASGTLGRTNGKAGTSYTVTNNVNYGNMTAKSVGAAYASGGIGQAFNNATESIVVDGCANLGALHAETSTEGTTVYAGGVIGYESVGGVTVKNCAATGVATAAGVNKTMLPGGIVGVSNPGKASTIKDCIATTSVCGWLGDNATVENCTDKAEAAVVEAAIKVIEDAPKATTSVTVNGTVYNFVVKTEAPETTTPEAPETTTPSTPSTPNTGDVTSVIVLALVAACTGAVLTIKKAR